MLALVLVVRVPNGHARAGGARLAVATENVLASRVALAEMRAGGNAVDAAVAAVLAGGVVSPVSNGLGGGGFAMVWLAKQQRAVVLDFREVAPQAIDAAAFDHRPFPATERGRAIGVPGELAGTFELSQRFGKRPWKDLVAPAIRLAKDGFAIEPHVAATLKEFGRHLAGAPGIGQIFYPHGHPAVLGQIVKNPKLAATLERVAALGPKAVYAGPVARDLVDTARSVGGALTLADLAAYKPIERKPVHVRWSGYDVYTMPLPSAGGLMVAQTLELYSKTELEKLGFNSGAYEHMLAEAMRGAIADRMHYLGDPAFQKVDFDGLIAPARMAARRRRLALDRTHAIPRFGLREAGTHELVTADGEGNVVSLTTTVNHVFGAKIAGRQSGIVLNDELDDFSSNKAVAPFGMKQSPNRARPGARPISSMTPTIVVKDGRAVLGLGGSGGTTIDTNVTQVALSVLAFGHTPQQALGAPRFYVPSRGAFLLLEKGAPPSLIRDLEWRGEVVGTMPFTTSAVQLITIGPRGRKRAAADPRKRGQALVY
jgi:gamma-glutamyltranspeptidase